MVRRILILCLTLFAGQAVAQSCDSTLSAGAAVGTAISSASAGSTICLNDGNYSGFTLSGVSKSPRVTVRAVNSRQANFTSEVTIRSATVGVTFSGINIAGVTIGTSPSADTTREITFTDFTVNSGGIQVQNLTHATPNVLLENFTSNDKTASSSPGSGRVWLTFDDPNSRSGLAPALTIRRATMDGNCADGINVGLAIIIEHSVFSNMQVANCPNDPHTDAVQFYGSNFTGSQVRYNYFYCNVQGLTAYDGVDGVVIEHNVFDPGPSGCGGSGTIERRQCQIEWLSDNGSTIQNNTIINRGSGYGQICLGSKPVDDAGVNTIIRNNIAAAIDLDGGFGGDATVPSVNTKNLLPSGGGTNITGSPTFQGTCEGQHQASNWVGCALSDASAGRNAGTDSKDVGTRFYGIRKPTGLN